MRQLLLSPCKNDSSGSFGQEREERVAAERCKVLLPLVPAAGTDAQNHWTAKKWTVLGSVGELDRLVPMVSIFQTPASARAFSPYENLMHIRRDG